MSERYAEPGCVFFYYVTAGGDVHFGLNNEEKGIFFSGVDVSRPLWCLVDIYGNATALEIVRKFPHHGSPSDSAPGVIRAHYLSAV